MSTVQDDPERWPANNASVIFIENTVRAIREGKSVFDITKLLQRAGDTMYAYEKHMIWMAQTVHQAYHGDSGGLWENCRRDVCQSTRTILNDELQRMNAQ